MSFKYELHFYPFPLSRDVRNQFNCISCQDSLGIMCIFSFSHTEYIFALNNYCQSWIGTCQSCRKESNPFLQTLKANINLLCSYFYFFFYMHCHFILFEYFSMNEFSENVVHKKSLGRSSADVQLVSEKLHSVTSWRRITVNLKSSLGDYSPHVNTTVPITYPILRNFTYWVRGQTVVWDRAQAIHSSPSFMTKSWTPTEKL